MIDDDLATTFKDGARAQSKALPAIGAALPWVDGSNQYPAVLVAAEVARVWATPKGALSTNRYAIAECMDDNQGSVRVPYASTIRDHMPYLPSYAQELTGNYNEPVIDELGDCTLQSQFEAARQLGHVRVQRSILVVDGKPTPLYADSWTYGNRPRRLPEDMTPSGAAGLPMFRGRKRAAGSDPLFNGTCNGLEMANATMIDPFTMYNGIYGFRRMRMGSNICEIAARLVEPLEDSPPALLLGDKELGHKLADGHLMGIRQRLGIHLMLAVSQIDSVKRVVTEMWADRGRVHLIDRDAPYACTLWGMERSKWWGGPYGYRLLILFRTDPPKDESLAVPETRLVLDVDGKKVPVYAAAFAVTFDEDFMHRHAKGIEPIFGHRWSTENVNKKTDRQGTALPSKGMFLRHWGYHGSVATQNNWQSWRLQRERSRELTRWHPTTSLQTYLDGLRSDLLPLASRVRLLEA